MKVIFIEQASIGIKGVGEVAADAETTIALFAGYGGASYGHSYRRIVDAAMPRLHRGSRPSVVPGTIAGALSAFRHWARYLVGEGCRQLAALAPMPQGPVFDALRRWLFGLPAQGSLA